VKPGFKITISLSCTLLLFSCAPSHFVKPLAKNQHAGGVTTGGPLIKYEKLTIPIPFLTIKYGYGVDSSLTVSGALNVTSALFGNLQAELGATKQILKQRRYLPAVSFSAVTNLIYRNKDAFKIYPQLDMYLFREHGKHGSFYYAGICNWFELADKRSLEQPQQNNWMLTPLAGYSFNRVRWIFNTEIKFIAPDLSNENLVIEYKTPLHKKGAFGVYISYVRKF